MKKRLFTLTAYVMAACLLISAFPMSAAAKTNTQKTNATTIKAKNLTIYIKHTKKFSYSIANKVGKTTFKSSDKKVVKITNKGKVKAIRKGTAYITIANNGTKKLVKVKVKNPQLNHKQETLQKGQTIKLKVKGKIGKVTFKSNNPNIAKVTNKGKVTAVNVGKTTITVKANGKKLKNKVFVINSETSYYKGIKTKIVRNYNELFNEVKKSTFTVMKGIEPKYLYFSCYFDTTSKKIDQNLGRLDRQNYDNPDNYYSYGGLYAQYENNEWDNKNKVWVVHILPTFDYPYLKRLYKAATKAIKEYKMDSYKEDYQKLLALQKWFDDNVTYGDCGGQYEEDSIIIYHSGQCGAYAAATDYFCTLLKIPSVHVTSIVGGHGWNVVKIQGKWYHMDILWHLMFYGTNEITKIDSHPEFDFCVGMKGTGIKVEKHNFVIPET